MSDLNGEIQEICGDEFSDLDLTKEQYTMIELEIFLCDDCGWWCESIEEGDDGGICTDCEESSKEDDGGEEFE